jgi:TfoX/Sxy family transcriptional regulator of competence genes
MPYSEALANRIREKFSALENVDEKEMMGGLKFMYNDKMCVGIFRGQLRCRISPDVYEAALEKQGCQTMKFNGRVMKGYVRVDETGIKTQKDFDYWVGLALEFNGKAKASKKKK